MNTVREIFYGRELYSSSLLEWEKIAKEYIPHFMWYEDGFDDDEKPVRAAWCSYCGAFNLFYKDDDIDIYTCYSDLATCKHGSFNYCPCCDQSVRYINQRKMTSYNSLRQVQRLIFSDFIDYNHVNFYAVRVRNYPDREFEEQLIDFEPSMVYELSPGSVKIYRYAGNDQWVERKTICEPFNTYFGHGGDYEFALLGHECFFDGTFLQYAQFQDFENLGMSESTFYGDRYYFYMTYLCQYCLHPQIEYLMKVGSYKWVYDLVYNRNLNKNFIDWNAKSFAGMFRLDKKSVKDFLSVNLSPVVLELYHKYDDKVPIEDICYIFRNFSPGFYQDVLDLCNQFNITIERLNKYLFVNIIPRDRHNSRLFDSTFQMWRDYINSCITCGVDLSDSKLLFPSDLPVAHDERVSQCAILENHLLLQRAKRSLERRDKQYCFEDDQFVIYLPHSYEEFIDESRMQKNCVAKNYIERHFKDETTILFLREKTCIDKSFYTIEVHGRTVVQKKGALNDIQPYSNASDSRKEIWAAYMERPREAADVFFKRWLSWLKNGSLRDEKGIPIEDNVKKKVRKNA